MKTKLRPLFMILGTLGMLLPLWSRAQAPTGAPTITTQPASLTVAAGAKATLNVAATGTAPLTYRWYKEARLVANGTTAAYVLDPVKVEDAGVYRVEVSNNTGTATSNSATLTVTPAPAPVGVAPVITTQPTSSVVTTNASATFTVTATGTPAVGYQWYKNGESIRNATAASLTLGAVKLDDAAAYHVRVSNENGSVVSNVVTLSVNAIAGVITAGPQSQAVKAGSSATLSVTAIGANLTYQWRHQGRAIKGATTATLTLNNVGTTTDGTYAVTVSNSSGPAGIAVAALVVTVDARLVNISTRGHVGDDDEVLITGFVVRGTGTKKILARAVGPTLTTAFGVPEALAKPTLSLYNVSRGSALLESNSGWGGSAELAATFASVGAFSLAPTSADAALLKSLGAGAYSAQISAPKGSEGVALAEVYDADTGTPGAEVVNISTRAAVGAEVKDTLIAGFAITGTTSDTVIVRGVGASLGTLFGLRRALGASQVTVYNSAGVQVASNTVWGGRDDDEDDDMDRACDRAGTWKLPRGSKDSALILTLAPGVYTAHVTGVNRASGIALVEIYEVH